MIYNSIVLELLGAELLITLIVIMWLILGVVLFEGVTQEDVKKFLRKIGRFFKKVGKGIAKATKATGKGIAKASKATGAFFKRNYLAFIALFKPKAKPKKKGSVSPPAKSEITTDRSPSLFVGEIFRPEENISKIRPNQ